MNFNIKSIQKNLTLIIGLLVLVVAGFAFYILKPQYDKIKQIKAEILAEQSNLTTREQKFKNIKMLLSNYKGVEEQLYNLSLSLPLKKDIPNLLVQLEALAVKNGVLMKSVSYEEEGEKDETKKVAKEETPPASSNREAATEEGALTFTTGPEEPEGSKTDYSILSVGLNLSAHYDSFMKYLEDVQRSFRFLDVTAIDFTITDTSDSGGSSGEEKEAVSFEDQTFEFSVQLKTYYLE